VHVEFTDKEDKIKIEGPPEEVEKAQASLEKMARDLISKLTFVEMVVDPKFYKHIIGKSGANVNRMKDELGVVINIAENDSSNLIRIEGNKTGVEKAKEVLYMLFVYKSSLYYTGWRRETVKFEIIRKKNEGNLQHFI
jgi:polyribonucleotide nucleotidyltransferase